MRPNAVKSALKAGQRQLGMNFGVLRSAEIPRLLAAAGFHFAFIDTEHGGFPRSEKRAGLSAALARSGRPLHHIAIVRVADLQYTLVARALDCGAQGIIFPRVEIRSEVARNGR